MEPLLADGCMCVRLVRVGTDDEGVYTCTVANSEGTNSCNIILLVDGKNLF